jgi:hypothetical protein
MCPILLLVCAGLEVFKLAIVISGSIYVQVLGLSLYVGEHAKTNFFEDVPEKDMLQTGNRVFFPIL